MAKTVKKKCKSFEREWQGLCVDKNLQDGWLQRLNALTCLRVISICEGHSKRRAGQNRPSPHIKLRLKDQYLPAIAKRWEGIKIEILERVDHIFQCEDTQVNLDLRFKLRWGGGRIVYQQDLTVRIQGRRPRHSRAMDHETVDWFQENVRRVEALDEMLAGLLYSAQDVLM